MAQRIVVNSTADFGGRTYNIPTQYLAFDRQYSSDPSTYTENLYGTYISYAVERITHVLGFNPFNIITFYTAGTFSNIGSIPKSIADQLGLNYEHFEGSGAFSNHKLLNGSEFPHYSSVVPYGRIQSNVFEGNNWSKCSFSINNNVTSPTGWQLDLYLRLFPISAFNNGGDSLFDMDIIPGHYQAIHVNLQMSNQITYIACNSMTITVDSNTNEGDLDSAFRFLNTNQTYLTEEGEITQSDSRNPYGPDIAVTGGGTDGDPFMDVDDIKDIEFPELPTLSAASAGLCTLYNPTLGQMQALSAYLWESPTFDINDFKRLFASPMDAIIGLGIIPVTPTLGGSHSVMFGNIDSGVAMSTVGNQFVEKDMGTVKIKKWVDCFLDYDDTQIEIYVPYCGTYKLDPVEVMGKTLHLKYHIDCLTGGCAAMLAVNGSIMYQWNGSCIANVPLTAMNYATAIQNAVSAVGNIGSMAAGGNPIAGLSSATNAVMNVKPQVQKGGNMGGSAGLMSVQQAYIIITRPNMSVPNKLSTFAGNTLNMTMKLANAKGFTQVEMIHLDSVPCTQSERNEILSLLKEGVIF